MSENRSVEPRPLSSIIGPELVRELCRYQSELAAAVRRALEGGLSVDRVRRVAADRGLTRGGPGWMVVEAAIEMHQTEQERRRAELNAELVDLSQALQPPPEGGCR